MTSSAEGVADAAWSRFEQAAHLLAGGAEEAQGMAMIEGSGAQAYALAQWILRQQPEMLDEHGILIEQAEEDGPITVRVHTGWGSTPATEIPPSAAVTRARARRARVAT